MSRNPDEIRRDIDQARGRLGATLEAIGDRVSPKLAKERAKEKVTDRMEEIKERVSPKRIVARRTARMRSGLRNVRESVMGAAGDVEPSRATDSVRGGAQQVRGGAQQVSRRVGRAAGTLSERASAAPEVVRSTAQGNPLLAGLVALGGGMILASALPPTEAEKQAAQRALEGLEPLKEQAVSTGRSMAGELQQSAQARAERVKKRASSGAQRVKSEAQSSAEDVKGQAQGASKRVQKRAKRASKQVQGQAKRSATTVKRTAKRSARSVKAAARS